MQENFLMKILILCLFALLLVPVMAQDEEADFPDIIGKAVPEAEALLNAGTYRLDPIILAVDSGTNTDTLNTVDSFEIAEDGIIVQVTVFREYNVELIWENTEAFAGQPGLVGLNLNNNELFTLVNLSDEELSLRNIQIGNFEISAWGDMLRPRQCAQAWSFDIQSFIEISGCEFIQGGSIVNITNPDEQFWINNESFEVFQNGIHRGRCVTADGGCQLWLSPLVIAEDIAPYILLIYDMNELVIYNSSDSQWMDINHIAFNDSAAILSDVRNWDAVAYPDIARLAPGQCVRFTNNLTDDNESIENCFTLARQDTSEADMFWTEGFIVNDTLKGTHRETCPPASNERTICLFGR